MTVFEAIRQALKETYPEIPAVPYTYDGDKDLYITYNYAHDRGGDFGDNQPSVNVVSVQVHLWLPKRINFQSYRTTVRSALFRKGFTYPDVTVLEEDTMRHIVFACEYEEQK